MGNGIDSVKANTGKMYLVTPGAPFAATQENGITKENVGKAPGIRGLGIAVKAYTELFKGNPDAPQVFLGGPLVQPKKFTSLYNEDEFKQALGVSKKEFIEASIFKKLAIGWLGGN